MSNVPLLEDLRVFCTVVRNSSFSRSASELGVSPAYVSKRIAQLEDVMRVILLHRTTRSVVVTSDGEIAYQWANKILADVNQMKEAVTVGKSVPSGLLRICTSSGFGRNRVALAVSQFAPLYPGVEVQLEFIDRPVDLIREGFDIDIRVGAVREHHLIARRLAANRRILCAAPSYLEKTSIPGTLSDLARHQCLAIRERDQGFAMWRLQGPSGIDTVKVNGQLSTNNGEIAHRWALDGHGIILRSMWDVRSSVANGQLVRVLPEYSQEADIWAAYPIRVSASAKVCTFVQFLADYLKNDGVC